MKGFQLTEVGRIVTGKTPKTSRPEYFGGDIPFVTPSDMQESRVIESTGRSLTADGAATVKNLVIPRHAVMVSCIGSDMGKTYLSNGRCVTNQQINSIIVDREKFDPLFIYYNLSGRRSEIRNAAAGAAQPILNKTEFGKILVEAPSLEEQREIAATLGALDDKIELNRKTAATLEEMARALYRSWFVDFDPVRARAEGRAPAHMDAATAALFPDTFGKDGLPEGWSKAPLNTLCKITSGKRPSQKVLTENADNPIPVYGGNGISWFTNKKLFDDKFLVTGRVGTLGTVFRVQEACWVSDNALCLFPKNDAGFEYLFFALSQIDILSLNSGSTQPLLTQTSLAAQNCLLPNQRVILSFHEYVFPWFESQRHLVSQNRTLAILRDTLLPRLMSGELRVAAARELIEEVA
ncbi:restriction endonuclease subunit S [Acetobacter oeni]|uniref:Type I restriction system specificity protein n=1 Tax=Acetobacter oeni TaxID=304077 RepID=A0A511XLB2_9PROT|nr:restriction endonuclease subunit S [Acetobacter oeni]MBB3883497.1 type I restriction enzyme S subunit [Acetobacter oeni]NHO19538.1 hypothetical protein [Acetobacter oeni]GBR03204.1 type I restriction-modification system specificity subunit [Acetobacter oeni LMG 21952]GEN63718.1 type I restriction system specificity protein [Acetobacter oeni]